jgi:beta-glucosidase
MSNHPWMDPALPVDARVAFVLAEMTRAEKLTLVNGHIGNANPGRPAPPEGAMGSAGYVAGVDRLGLPAQQETDASLGVANLHDGIGATALPSGLAIASSWDEALAHEGGAMIGAEARAKGFNVMLAGGVNLTREPRCGRNFEYLGEDPLLAGSLCGASIRGIQSNNIVATIKHFVLNAQETGRFVLSAEIDEAALRESDLLAFEIGIERGDPGSVMTAYNRINGVYAGEHDFLLNTVLKGDWGFRGWTMSDWGGCHSTEKAVLGGLDQESGQELDREPYYAKLDAAIEEGRVPAARLDDMATRILRPLFQHGAVDAPAKPGGAIDRAAHLAVAQRASEAGVVLLKNDGDILPLTRAARAIAVIGEGADVGVLSGGGSSSVVPWGGFARETRPKIDSRWANFLRQRWHPSSPLAAIAGAAPQADIRFHDGEDRAGAAQLAASCDVAIVVANQWTTEFLDAPDLSLPHDQDALIAAVAAANARTIVVLETGGPVLMPWLGDVAAVMEAWYPGGRGGEAIAAILFGDVNPSGRLPLTFPRSERDLPNPQLPGADVAQGKFDAPYPEGADVGYRWYAKTGRAPLFHFGFGLSYTTFRYENLLVAGGADLTAQVDVTNIGARAGAETAQFYLTDAAGEKTLRLIGWRKLALAPGETGRATITADPRLLARYDVSAPGWRVQGGRYGLGVGAHAGDLRLAGEATLAARLVKP